MKVIADLKKWLTATLCCMQLFCVYKVHANEVVNDFSRTYGKYEINITCAPFHFELIDRQKKIKLLSSKGDVILRHQKNTNVVYAKPYYFFEQGSKVFEAKLNKVTRIVYGEKMSFYLGNTKFDSLAVLHFFVLPDSTFCFDFKELSANPAGVSVISEITINFDADTEDTYFGMGMRYNTVNHYGTIVTQWASEVGPNLPVVSDNATLQGRDITYAPVPFFLNLKGYGLHMNDFNYSVFDFAKSSSNTFSITNKSGAVHLKIFTGETPLQIIGKYFNANGKFKLPKPWVFGVWAAAGTDYQSKESGQEINYTVLNTCRKNKIPLSAIMAEDWYFDFLSSKPINDWTVNRKYYPGYEKMIAEQHRLGVKNIGYYLPYLGQKKMFKPNPDYMEADTKGLLTKNKKGKSFVFKFFVWNSSQFDWTNPEAGKYFQSKYYANSEKMGVDGWMNDFGEYTPYRSISYNGAWGNDMHNKYPLLWAKNAQDFFGKARPNGDYCLFSRSGAAGLHQYNDFIFTGDRNANYDKLSGIGGQITGVLSGSMSVHPNVSIDIGAYNCEKTKPMNKLLMFRWIEAGALIPVMRLHRGVQLCDHWRFDEDEETLLHWKKYATLHAKLFPYIYTLAKQASDNGWPMLRHLSIHFPQDRECLKQDFEFMLGDRMLSCPVIEDQLDVKRNDITQANHTWKVYLPEGKWYHYWTDKCYQGASAYEVPAAPGSLPFFIREGKILPTFNREVDTFVEGVEQNDIKDFEEVNKEIKIYFYGYGEDRLQLWDGTVIACSRKKGEQGNYQISNPNGRTYDCVFVGGDL
ncbi:MAG: TIM-barrel domain-containing protein [Bacteroidota bacterium]